MVDQAFAHGMAAGAWVVGFFVLPALAGLVVLVFIGLLGKNKDESCEAYESRMERLNQ